MWENKIKFDFHLFGYILDMIITYEIFGYEIMKGQLISKWFFGVIDFLQKKNEQIQLYYYDTSGTGGPTTLLWIEGSHR